MFVWIWLFSGLQQRPTSLKVCVVIIVHQLYLAISTHLSDIFVSYFTTKRLV